MKVIIEDEYGNTEEFSDIPIPRIGERVEWKFNPAPTVTDVLYLLKSDEVFVKVR